MKGLVHVYTGNGKGKTTAAVGLGIRACGRGFKVLMLQFLKGTDTGELHTLKALEPGFTVHRAKQSGKFTWDMNEEELTELEKKQQEIFKAAEEAVSSGSYDLIILDEIMAAMTTGLVERSEVVNLIRSKPEKLEIVLTGRDMPLEIFDAADYVSEIQPLKHPMNYGVPARRGIEY